MARKAWPLCSSASASSSLIRSRRRMSPPCASRKIRADQIQRQRVPLDVVGELLALLQRPLDPEPFQQPRAGLVSTAARGRAAARSRAKPSRSLILYRVVTRQRPSLRWARPFSSARRPSSFNSPGVGEVGAYCSGSSPSRIRSVRFVADQSREPLALVVRALAFDRRRAEEFQRLRRGRGRTRRSAARASPGCRTTRRRPPRSPASPCATPDGPFGDQRRLALPAERDEGQRPRMRLARPAFAGSSIERRFSLAPDQLSRRVAVDAGDVEGGRRRKIGERGHSGNGGSAVGVPLLVSKETTEPSGGLTTAGWPVSSRYNAGNCRRRGQML